MIFEDKSIKKIFITGGSGFIGSHLCDLLLLNDYSVTVYDNFSNGKIDNINQHLNNSNFQLINNDCNNFNVLKESIKNHDLVFHLAANTDLISSHNQPDRDLKDCVLATFNLLEAMRVNKIKNLLFASSGAVYGKLSLENYVNESDGPLAPMSPYGAGKISSEAFIHAYSHLYGINSLNYRFGNVVGSRLRHGVIFDFINKLRLDNNKLLILGDGKQEKNYFYVKDCLDGMIYLFNNYKFSDNIRCDFFNLGTKSISSVSTIANLVIKKMNLSPFVEIEGKKYAWPGDQPKVYMNTSKTEKYGWKPKYSSDEAVCIAIDELLNEQI